MEYADFLRSFMRGRHAQMTLTSILEEVNEGTLFSDVAIDKEGLRAYINTEIRKDDGVVMRVKKGSVKLKLRPQAKVKKVTPVDMPDSNYVGKAGEYCVMAELLFRGYNANNMSVDEGIDIVASKNNAFYFVQVKTTSLNEKMRAYTKIKKSSFEAVIDNNVRYVIVIKTKGGYEYFAFKNDDIERFIRRGFIKESEGLLNIKIRYDEKSNLPYLYDERDEEISDYTLDTCFK